MNIKLCYITTKPTPDNCNVCVPKKESVCVDVADEMMQIDEAHKSFQKLMHILQLKNYEPYRKL